MNIYWKLLSKFVSECDNNFLSLSASKLIILPIKISISCSFIYTTPIPHWAIGHESQFDWLVPPLTTAQLQRTIIDGQHPSEDGWRHSIWNSIDASGNTWLYHRNSIRPSFQIILEILRSVFEPYYPAEIREHWPLVIGLRTDTEKIWSKQCSSWFKMFSISLSSAKRGKNMFPKAHCLFQRKLL